MNNQEPAIRYPKAPNTQDLVEMSKNSSETFLKRVTLETGDSYHYLFYKTIYVEFELYKGLHGLQHSLSL